MTAVISGSGTTTSGLINVGSAITTTGTSPTVTGISSAAKRITIMLHNVVMSTNVNYPQFQVGSGSLQTTGYYGYVGYSTGAGSAGGTTGFYFLNTGGTGASWPSYGIWTFTNISGNNWCFSGVGANAGRVCFASGYVTTSGPIDRVALNTASTDTFTSGTMNVFWE